MYDSYLLIPIIDWFLFRFMIYETRRAHKSASTYFQCGPFYWVVIYISHHHSQRSSTERWSRHTQRIFNFFISTFIILFKIWSTHFISMFSSYTDSKVCPNLGIDTAQLTHREAELSCFNFWISTLSLVAVTVLVLNIRIMQANSASHSAAR